MAAYRTFPSVSITGRIDEELVKHLPRSLKFICHNGMLGRLPFLHSNCLSNCLSVREGDWFAQMSISIAVLGTLALRFVETQRALKSFQSHSGPTDSSIKQRLTLP